MTVNIRFNGGYAPRTAVLLLKTDRAASVDVVFWNLGQVCIIAARWYVLG